MVAFHCNIIWILGINKPFLQVNCYLYSCHLTIYRGYFLKNILHVLDSSTMKVSFALRWWRFTIKRSVRQYSQTRTQTGSKEGPAQITQE